MRVSTPPAVIAFAIPLSCALTMGSAPASAQQAFEIRGPSPCATCRIVLTRVATLWDSAFTVDYGGVQVLRDRVGRFLVSGEQHAAVGLYSPTGQFIRKLGGRGL